MNSRIPGDFSFGQNIGTNYFPGARGTARLAAEAIDIKPFDEPLTFSSDSTAELRVAESDSAVAICVPDNYEENYAYPLLIWLPPTGGSERDLPGVMQSISTQNYFGMSLRGLMPCPEGFGWSQSPEQLADLADRIYRWVGELRREYHIHSERVFVAGFDDGGTTALSLLLDHPDWFAGAVSMSGPFPWQRNALVRFRELRDCRVLLTAGAHDRVNPIGLSRATNRLLYSAGVSVSLQTFESAHEPTPEMYRFVDQWMMQGIREANLV